MKKKIKNFIDSLNKIPNVKLIKLVDEIDKQRSKDELSMEKYFKLINKKQKR